MNLKRTKQELVLDVELVARKALGVLYGMAEWFLKAIRV